jgi:hypothetical protein
VSVTVPSRLFQFGKRAASEAAKFGRGGVEFFGVVGAARLECGEPAAGSGERRAWSDDSRRTHQRSRQSQHAVFYEASIAGQNDLAYDT